MTLREEVTNYKNESMPVLEEILRWYQKKNIDTAIQCAAEALNPNGTINSHQRRIGAIKLAQGAQSLIRLKNKIRKCISFEEIFMLTEEIRLQSYGLGDLWSYDTALRIGFNLKKYPRKVYIQAGVIKGAKKALGKSFIKSRTKKIATTCIA